MIDDPRLYCPFTPFGKGRGPLGTTNHDAAGPNLQCILYEPFVPVPADVLTNKYVLGDSAAKELIAVTFRLSREPSASIGGDSGLSQES